MSKIKIVYENLRSINSDWVKPMLDNHFDFAPYSSNDSYDKKSTIFYFNSADPKQTFLQFLNEGYVVICDNLWETIDFETVDNTLSNNANFLKLHNVNWFWYNESLWYKHLGYDQYRPRRTYRYTALMPMNIKKKHRDYLQKTLADYLDDFVWSYASCGVVLPGANDPNCDRNAQRAFVAKWYDDTCFSIVAETTVTATKDQPVFITEKTFKPIAFEQPFMVCGTVGTLAYLKTQGFETFDNVFDESYDSVASWLQRAKVIKYNVANYKKQEHSQLTLDKIRHNRELFFDSALIKKRIFNEIVNPIFHCLESQ